MIALLVLISIFTVTLLHETFFLDLSHFHKLATTGERMKQVAAELESAAVESWLTSGVATTFSESSRGVHLSRRLALLTAAADNPFLLPPESLSVDCPAGPYPLFPPSLPVYSYLPPLLSSRTCNYHLSEDSSSRRVLGNLVVDSDSKLLSPTLIIEGAFFNRGTATLERDLMLIAWGDIYIEVLEAINSVNVAIFSFTGSIIIQRIAGPITVAVSSFHEHRIPAPVVDLEPTAHHMIRSDLLYGFVSWREARY